MDLKDTSYKRCITRLFIIISILDAYHVIVNSLDIYLLCCRSAEVENPFVSFFPDLKCNQYDFILDMVLYSLIFDFTCHYYQ